MNSEGLTGGSQLIFTHMSGPKLCITPYSLWLNKFTHAPTKADSTWYYVFNYQPQPALHL